MPTTDFSNSRVQSLLGSRDTVVLATIQPSGAPLAMAMWFVHDHESVAMISVDGLQKVKNLRRDPRVCVVVESVGDQALRCASVQGRVEFVESPEQQAPLVDRLFQKYGDALAGRWAGRQMPRDRVMFRVLPERVYYWGGGR